MSDGNGRNGELRDYVKSLIDGLREEMRSGFDEVKAETRALNVRLDGVDARMAAFQSDFQQVYLRLEAVESALRGELYQLRAEAFRLRAALYLLAKDRPDILKLLGEEAPEQ